MIDAIDELGAILGRDELTMETAEAALAEAKHPAVRQAELVAADETGAVAHATLLPSADGELQMAALEARYGPGRQAPLLHPDRPRKVLFYPPAPDDAKFTWVVIAAVRDETVESVIVRRDAR